jgi:hypothetical protein
MSNLKPHLRERLSNTSDSLFQLSSELKTTHMAMSITRMQADPAQVGR